MNTKELVDKAREHSGYKSLRELAEGVGVNHSSLSLLASGKGELSDETYIKLAELAGVDPAEVILEKHLRKAGPKGRAVWERIAKTLPRTAALLAGVAIILLINQHTGADNLNLSFVKWPLC